MITVARAIEELAGDIRHACRGLRRLSWFSLTAVVCLGLGTGLATMMLSIANAVLFTPLPFPEAERTVVIWFTPRDEPDQRFGTNSGVYSTIA